MATRTPQEEGRRTTVIGLVLVGCALVLWFVVASNQPPGPAAPVRTEAEIQAQIHRDHPEYDLRITNLRGRLGGFDSVLVISGRMTNVGTAALRDPVIRCTMAGNSGTLTDVLDQPLLEVIRPGQTIRFRDLNMGFRHQQSATFGCQVHSAATD